MEDQPGAERIASRRLSCLLICATVAAFAGAALPAQASDAKADNISAPPPPPPPAPLGVFGADMPAAGRLVFSIIPQFAHLSTTLKGTRAMSSEEVVATTPWFFDPTKKLRGVPQDVSVAFQTLQAVYGLTNDIAIVAAIGTLEKNLDFLTFKGESGITRLGMSYTGTGGLTDSMAAAVVRVYEDPINRIQINFGFSFPTGSIHAPFTLLQPTGVYATSRAFYAMQLGSGTFDALPGIVYAGHLAEWSWGVSYRGRFPIAANPDGYLWGDLHEFNGWGGYSWIPGVTTTFRVNATVQGPIRGFDPEIRGKAQAANPNFYGGQRVELFGGFTINGKVVGLDNVILTIEAGAPVYQYLNGPQLSKNWQAGMALRFKI